MSPSPAHSVPRRPAHPPGWPRGRASLRSGTSVPGVSAATQTVTARSHGPQQPGAALA
jgi:hypothetical protein